MGKFSDEILAPAQQAQDAPAGGRFSSAILGEATPGVGPPPVETSTTGDFLRGFGDTALLSFGDEAEAAAIAAATSKTYAEALKEVRAKHEAAGPAFFAGMGAGMFVPGLGVAGTAARGATTAAKLGRAALGGILEGGIAGFGAGEGGPGEEGALAERLPGAAFGAAIGAPLGAAGQAVGQGLSKFAQRRMARDIDRLDPAKVAGLEQKAKAQGIQLTPAEVTNLPSLKAQQKALGNLPQSADDLSDFYAGRAEEQIEPAVQEFLERFSPIEGAEVAGLRGRAAAQRAMDDVAAKRAEQAAPLYLEAFAENPIVETKPILDFIRSESARFPESGEVRRQLTKAGNLLMRADTVTPTFRQGRQVATPSTPSRMVPETGLANLHSAKMEIDQMINAADADKRLGPVVKAELTKVRKMLKGELEDASRLYEEATNIYADLTPGVERVREGVTGIIANLKDNNARLAASKLFNPETSGPVLMREAKKQIKTADPDAWQGLKRAWLEEQWIKAGQETLEGGPRVNRGALFRKALMGNQRQKKMLFAALEPAEFRALNDLSQVLEASGRVKSVGSDTAWNQELMRVQRQGASSMLSRVLRLSTPDVLKNVAERWDERRLAQQSEKLVGIITSPQGVQFMRELKRLPARDVFKRAVLAQALASGAIVAGAEGAAPAPPQPAGPPRVESR